MAKQLTLAERYQIYVLMKAGHSKTESATQLARQPATSGRALQRNRGGRGYRPQPAQAKAEARQKPRLRPRISSATWELIESLIRQDWSPEQLSGWLKTTQRLRVSPERIDQHI